MNTKGADWDTNAHDVYDARRMPFDATVSERSAVDAGRALPEYGPRKDYGVRLAGPAARDVEEILGARWQEAMASGALYADRATPLDLDAAAAEGQRQVQVVATLPEPWNQQAIRETHTRAMSQATSMIFIEDQYYRAPLVEDAIVARMLAEPDLVLVVVTMAVSSYDGGAKFTYLADRAFRELFPDRYLLLRLRTSALLVDDAVTFTIADMDTHSKLRIVDDQYLSVGSCNFNNRGYLFEGEMDVAVLDPEFVIDARATIFAELVGPDFADRLTGDGRADLEVFREAAAHNEEVLAWWEDHRATIPVAEAEAEWASRHPSGFVLPLEIRSDYEFDVGPDTF
jgi:phosphatidylserine/phosphatidylglycerophosphate/cardiolipin synthase-like enzyme